jgi:G3E family GTPase
MEPEARPLPLFVLTGFLGSGKTTLLRRLLASAEFHDTAVLINEFGEVGLDHLLVRNLTDAAVLLRSGCVCCSIRGDLSEALMQLLTQRDRGEVPPFRRIVVETTGLADPTPILATLMCHPTLRYQLRLGAVTTTVDAVLGEAGLDRHPELTKQVAAADNLVLTKVDLVSQDNSERLRRRLERLNPAAAIEEAIYGQVEPWFIASLRTRAALRIDAAGQAPDACFADVHEKPGRRPVNTFAITLHKPVEWAAFGIWLSLLVYKHGAALLRIKGILRIAGSDLPVLIHGVQHLIHPPEHLPEWPDDASSSHVVFIALGLERQTVERSLRKFLRLGKHAAGN